MKYEVKPTAKFRKEYRLAEKRGRNMDLLDAVITQLARGETLSSKYKDHALAGSYVGCRECHIQPNWLLIYQIEEDVLVLVLSRTGSHSDLF